MNTRRLQEVFHFMKDYIFAASNLFVPQSRIERLYYDVFSIARSES